MPPVPRGQGLSGDEERLDLTGRPQIRRIANCRSWHAWDLSSKNAILAGADVPKAKEISVPDPARTSLIAVDLDQRRIRQVMPDRTRRRLIMRIAGP
jgi:hypothetical protein